MAKWIVTDRVSGSPRTAHGWLAACSPNSEGYYSGCMQLTGGSAIKTRRRIRKSVSFLLTESEDPFRCSSDAVHNCSSITFQVRDFRLKNRLIEPFLELLADGSLAVSEAAISLTSRLLFLIRTSYGFVHLIRTLRQNKRMGGCVDDEDKAEQRSPLAIVSNCRNCWIVSSQAIPTRQSWRIQQTHLPLWFTICKTRRNEDMN